MGSLNPTILETVIQLINKVNLEYVMIGNSASALHGVPITTYDIDFMIRNTPKNIEKLQKLAKLINGYLSQPFIPSSNMYRIINDEIQLDFIIKMTSIRSFESLRSRSENIKINRQKVNIANLEDIIKSKKACNRDKDKATLKLLQQVLKVKKELKK